MSGVCNELNLADVGSQLPQSHSAWVSTRATAAMLSTMTCPSRLRVTTRVSCRSADRVNKCAPIDSSSADSTAETGRAGRDGHAARCVLYYSAEDKLRIKELVRKTHTSRQRRAERENALMPSQRAPNSIDALLSYCENVKVCRHVTICESTDVDDDQSSGALTLLPSGGCNRQAATLARRRPKRIRSATVIVYVTSVGTRNELVGGGNKDW